MTDLRSIKPATGFIPVGLTASDEIVERRRSNGKTFYLGDDVYRTRTAFGAIHYKDNPADKKEAFKEIDLTVSPKGLMTTAPFDIKMFTNRIGYRYTSKAGGRVEVELLEVGTEPVNNERFKTRVLDNQYFWDNVASGVDLKVVLRPLSAEIFKKLASKTAPRRLLWDIKEEVNGKARFRRLTGGTDADGDRLEMITNVSGEVVESDADWTYKHYQYEEVWSGRVSRIVNVGSRQKDWFNDPKYPVTIDAATQELIQADVDDGHERVDVTTWYNNNNSLWYWGWSTAWGAFNGGVRFQTLGIPQGATINTASITLVVQTLLDGGIQATIYGDDVDDAPAWSNGSLPSGIAQTAASANFDPAATGTFTIGITTIVQEIISRGGWSSGNDIRFGFIGATGTYGFDGIYDYIQGQADAAILDVDYTPVVTRIPRYGFTNFQIPGIV